MKTVFLSSLLALALLASACSDDPNSSNPIVTSGARSASTLDLGLNLNQVALLDEMYYLYEDMSVLLDPVQVSRFNTLLSELGDDTRPIRGAVDMAAVAWFNLILRANPGLDTELLLQVRALIAASAIKRAEIMRSGANREEIAAQLKAEHDALIAAINNLVGPEAVRNAEALRERLEQERKERQNEMVQKRIEAEVQRMKAALGLTDEQAAKVRRILTYQHAQLQQIRETRPRDPEAMKVAIDALMREIDAMMRDAIGSDLWERWLKYRRGVIRPVDPVDPIETRVQHLTQLLGLDAEQAAALKRILTEQQAAIAAIMNDPNMDRIQKARELEEINKRAEQQIQALLTPEQLEKYLRHKGVIVTPDPVTPIDRRVQELTKLLDLTERQAASIKQILINEQEAIAALMKDPNMDRMQMAREIERIKKETEARIQALLTPEQLEKYLRLKGGVTPGGRG